MNEECARSSGVGPKGSDDEVRKEKKKGVYWRKLRRRAKFCKDDLGTCGDDEIGAIRRQSVLKQDRIRTRGTEKDYACSSRLK